MKQSFRTWEQKRTPPLPLDLNSEWLCNPTMLVSAIHQHEFNGFHWHQALQLIICYPWPALNTSVQFSCSVMSDSLWPHEPQHARAPCPSPTPGVYSNSCPLSWWCHPTISSSVIPFPSCPQSFPASGSFQMSQLFASGGQSIGVSASASVLPMNTQDWSPLGWTGWISLHFRASDKNSRGLTTFIAMSLKNILVIPFSLLLCLHRTSLARLASQKSNSQS